MAQDLLDRKLLIGLDETQVLALLGTPYHIDRTEKVVVMIYDVKHYSLFDMWMGLAIRLENHKVVKATIND